MNEPIQINSQLKIPASELVWKYSPSGGPGGQHANTSNTRAEVCFEITDSETLTEGQKNRLESKFGPRLRVAADDTRSQLRNRELAISRLVEQLRAALTFEKKRRPTKPKRGAIERRLKAKKKRSDLKSGRSSRHYD